jgi:hypothetical protein
VADPDDGPLEEIFAEVRDRTEGLKLALCPEGSRAPHLTKPGSRSVRASQAVVDVDPPGIDAERRESGELGR